jgi:phospholipase/lecithinase/hemolysin
VRRLEGQILPIAQPLLSSYTLQKFKWRSHMKKIFLWIALLFFTTSLFATPVKKMVYLGDSLSDNGNLYRWLHFIPKSPPYYNGRFSNGLVWSEVTEKYFFNKYNIQSANYATGGTNVFYENPFGGHLPYSLSSEMFDYVVRSKGHADSETLFLIWAGANDYTAGHKDIDVATTNVVNGLMKIVSNPHPKWDEHYGLLEYGAKYFIVIGMPDLSKAPFAKISGIEQNLHDLSVMHNEKLIQTIEKFQTEHPDIKIVYFDARSILDSMMSHIDEYNKKFNKHIKILDEACWKGGYTLQGKNDVNHIAAELQKNLPADSNIDTQKLAQHILSSPDLAVAYQNGKLAERGVMPCENPDDYMFWDLVHPSATTHEILASLIIDKILAEKFV